MDKEILQSIREKIDALCATFPREMSFGMYAVIERICFGAYKEEIPLLAHRTFSALGSVDCTRAIGIGAAHCLGWTAYYLFDRCGDERSGEISVAIALYRLMICEYQKWLRAENSSVLGNIIGSMDAANYAEEWAKNHTSWNVAPPAFNILAEKSRGHALAVLVPVIAAGYNAQSPAYRCALAMMDAIIIARQLSDDMLDWREDFDSGIVTRVNHSLFNKSGLASDQAIEVAMIEACKDIIRHTDKAAELARANPAFKNPEFFVRLTEKISAPARDFLSSHSEPSRSS